MKLWIDECLSPTLVDEADARGYAAACNRDRGLLGVGDRLVFTRAADEDFIFVTNNEGDFRALCEASGAHPGLIVLPQSLRDDQRSLFRNVIDYIERQAGATGEAPRDFMVNRVVEADDDGCISDYELPPSSA